MSSPPLLARKGRDKQRYEDNFRLVSGCIPYRVGKKSEEIQVCMVSSPDRDDLVFPKGGWEDDETVQEAARREAMEEAGLTGTLNENPVGVWEFRSKSSQDSEGGCRGYMFALEVTQELHSWPEQLNHYRIWLNTKEASRLCRYEWMRTALTKFLETMIIDQEKVVVVEEEQQVVELVSECQVVTPNCHQKPIPTFSWALPLEAVVDMK